MLFLKLNVAQSVFIEDRTTKYDYKNVLLYLRIGCIFYSPVALHQFALIKTQRI